jgi:DNA-binding CsgD family transcriptional regulator
LAGQYPGGWAVILRGLESFRYPSRKEFQHLGEIMHQMQTIQGQPGLAHLTAAVGQLIPHQYSGCGSFNIQKCAVQVGYSNYGEEHTHLYATQGFVTDPAIQLLQQTKLGTVSSEDSPDLVVPKIVTSLKLDSGIKTCLSVGVRGVFGRCTYYSFSNFDQKLLWKLRSTMRILAPHFHMAYMRATIPTEENEPASARQALTPREDEIMRWVAEGKTNWEISIILHVSLNTIKFHLKNVYEKLGGVENRWAAVAQWQYGSAGLLIPTARRNQNKTSAPSKP